MTKGTDAALARGRYRPILLALMSNVRSSHSRRHGCLVSRRKRSSQQKSDGDDDDADAIVAALAFAPRSTKAPACAARRSSSVSLRIRRRNFASPVEVPDSPHPDRPCDDAHHTEHPRITRHPTAPRPKVRDVGALRRDPFNDVTIQDERPRAREASFSVAGCSGGSDGSCLANRSRGWWLPLKVKPSCS